MRAGSQATVGTAGARGLSWSRVRGVKPVSGCGYAEGWRRAGPLGPRCLATRRRAEALGPRGLWALELPDLLGYTQMQKLIHMEA